MTNYTSLRVTDLKDLLAKRKLPTTGNKAELISRLEAADRDGAANSASNTTTTTPAPAIPTATTPETTTTTHLPSAEEYEINWDEDDTTTVGGPKSAKLPPAKPETMDLKVVTVASASAGATPAEKPKTVGAAVTEEEPAADSEQASEPGKKQFTFKRLADQFTDLPSTKKPDTKKSTATPTKAATTETKTPTASKSPQIEVKAEVATDNVAEKVPEALFSAHLPPTAVDAELEKRKARAARFGTDNMDPVAAESLKKLERAARFGTVNAIAASTDPVSIGVKGLDQALPEHVRKGKRSNEQGGGRGGVQKRARYGDRGQTGRRQGGTNGTGERRTGSANATNTQRKTGSSSAVKSILDDPVEREKAEKRKQRFGA